MPEYRLLPGTPQALEDDYTTEQARERKCLECRARKDGNLHDLRKYCKMGLCPEGN